MVLAALIKDRPPSAKPRERRQTEREKLIDQTTHAVVAVELLYWHGKLGGTMEQAFRKKVFEPVLPRLRRLTSRSASKDDFRMDDRGVKQSRPSRVHDEIIDRQFTLGHLFSQYSLKALQRKDNEPWNSMARWRSRQEFHICETHPEDDPAAKELVSWCQAIITMKDGRTVEIADRAVAHNDAKANIWILPVFVDHDRTTHAERQALLTIMEHLPIDPKTEGIPDGITGKARVFATHTPCISCLSSMCQFTRAFEGATLKVGFDVWKETRRWCGLSGPSMKPMGGDLSDEIIVEEE